MSKSYYELECNDGVTRQVWKVEEELGQALQDYIKDLKEPIPYNCFYIFTRFCDALEYFVRAGRKDKKTLKEDRQKAIDNLDEIYHDIRIREYIFLFLISYLEEISTEASKPFLEYYDKWFEPKEEYVDDEVDDDEDER